MHGLRVGRGILEDAQEAESFFLLAADRMSLVTTEYFFEKPKEIKP